MWGNTSPALPSGILRGSAARRTAKLLLGLLAESYSVEIHSTFKEELAHDLCPCPMAGIMSSTRYVPFLMVLGAPAVMDCVHSLRWLHAARLVRPPDWFSRSKWTRPQDRRIKVLPEEGKDQVTELSGERFTNKVGTYGMASAQLYWGRQAAALLRILYAVFPWVDWAYVFVDDFAWLLRAKNAPLLQ